jgi:putative ABC transport system ATP-binding protein
MHMMIEVANLTKSFRRGTLETEVLKGVTFSIPHGEFIAIMGPSGSGKSTLLNILGLLDRPDGGTYLLDGTDYSGATDEVRSAARNCKIGFVFQQFHLLDRAPAVRNVTLPLLYAENSGSDGIAKAERALDAVGLSHRRNYLPSELSGGEQQRVAIARALINDPPLILADEATGNLDAKSGAEVLDIFRRIVEEGRTLVLITHDLEVAKRADRILSFGEGRILANEDIRPRATDSRPGAAAPA